MIIANQTKTKFQMRVTQTSPSVMLSAWYVFFYLYADRFITYCLSGSLTFRFLIFVSANFNRQNERGSKDNNSVRGKPTDLIKTRSVHSLLVEHSEGSSSRRDNYDDDFFASFDDGSRTVCILSLSRPRRTFFIFALHSLTFFSRSSVTISFFKGRYG